MNNNNKLIEKMRLYRTENIGAITYKILLSRYSLEDAVEAAAHMAMMGGKKDLKIPSKKEMEEEIYLHEKIGAEILQEEDEDFPIAPYRDFPPIISILGDKSLLKKNLIGVVGTRLPSLQGMQYTKYICEFLGEHHYVIVSGFAKGIDTISHESSLKTGTIALLPCGIDVIFPAINMLLYNKIKNQGLLMTDRPLQQQALSKNFPQRNKLLAAICEGVVITEATLQSGSMMTANFAKKIQKPIFSVPGHPLDSRYSGNNNIIKNGGILIEKAETIIEYLKNHLKEEKLHFLEEFPFDSNVNNYMRNKILQLISFVPTSIEDICIYSGYSLGEVNYILIELELSGGLERLPNGQVSLIVKSLL